MTEESRVSRTPRTWTAGDDEPEDGTRVRDALGGEWVRRGRLWYSKIDPRLWSWVLIRGPLVEVLPDAPEPQPTCACFTVPEERWTKHYDATEPGSMVEPNPDCPVHFPRIAESRQIAVAPWCPRCRLTVGESLIRVPSDGKRIHATCGGPIMGERELRAALFDVTEEQAKGAAATLLASSLSDDTTRPDKPATEELSGSPEDDNVGTVRRLGNSWFVKLVEPRSEPWHVACSDGQQNVSGWQSNDDMRDCPVVGYVPIAECYTPSEVEAARELYRGLARVHDDLRAQINGVLDHPVMPSSEKVGAIGVILDAQPLTTPALSGVELRDAEERDDASEEDQ